MSPFPPFPLKKTPAAARIQVLLNIYLFLPKLSAGPAGRVSPGEGFQGHFLVSTYKYILIHKF